MKPFEHSFVAAPVPARPLPGPASVPVVGLLVSRLRFFSDPFRGLNALYRRYGEIAALEAGNPAYVCAFGPRYNHVLFANPSLFHSHISKLPAPPGSALERIRKNAFTMNGEDHKRQRRVIQPAFHRRHVDAYRDDIVVIADRILGGCREGETFDVFRRLQRLTLGVIVKILFGLDPDAVDAHVAKFVEQLNVFSRLFTSRRLNLMPVDFPLSPYRRLLDVADDLEVAIRRLVEERRGRFDAYEDVLSRLALANEAHGHPEWHDELIGQIFALLLAGHETTFAAMSWTLYLLAQHPDVMRDLWAELDAELRGDAPRVEQLARLPLLDRVIKESLRVLPPAAYGARIASAPCALGGYALPEGSVVIYSQYVTHHMPELFPEPEVFRPARWETIKPSPYEYFPFGTGPRTCPGAEFALLETKIVLAMLLQRYWPQVAPGQTIDLALKINMSAKPGLSITLRRVGKRFAPTPVRGSICDAVRVG